MTGRVPVDTRRIDLVEVSDEDYEAAEGARAEIKESVATPDATPRRMRRSSSTRPTL